VIRAVLDTNVLVSGLLSPSGNEASIILAIHQGMVRPCFTEEIVAEYSEVLARPKFAFPPDEIAALIEMFRRAGELFHPDASAAASPDPGIPNFCNAPSQHRPISLSPGTGAITRTRPMVRHTS
jgi:putative PIN family toxin of toxin-antitoxin system